MTLCSVDIELNKGDELYTKGMDSGQAWAPTHQFFSSFKAKLEYKKLNP